MPARRGKVRVFLTTAVVLGFLAAGSCGEAAPTPTPTPTATPTPTPTPSPTPTPPPVPMALYESTEHGFAIEYPEGWTEQSGGLGARFTLEARDPEGRLSVHVSVEYKTDEIALSDFISEGKTYMEALPQFELISEGPVTIGERISGYEMVGKGDFGTGEVGKFRFVVLVREKQGLSFGAYGEPGAYDEAEEILDAAVGSFRLLPTYTYVPVAPGPGGTYTSAEHGFSIVYPAGWMEAPAGRGEVMSFAAAEGLPTVGIYVHPAGEGDTVAERGPQLNQGLAERVRGYELVSEGEITLDDGTPAYEIVYTSTTEGYSLKSKLVIVIRGTDGFHITGYTMGPRFEQDEAAMGEVIRSFHLE